MSARKAAALAAVAVGGYLVGSISFTRVVGHRVAPEEKYEGTSLAWAPGKSIDSVTVSATTIETTAGPRLGALTSSLDILKATVPVAVLRAAAPGEPYAAVCATTVMAGHNFPIYHHFQGGRGTSTLLGALLVLDPLAIPVTIVAGQAIGLYVVRDVLFAQDAAWILLLPAWFALRGRAQLVPFGLAVNALRWGASLDEVRQWWHYYRAGDLRTEEFHAAIEQTHMGYIHGRLRARGWIRYDYMESTER